MFRGGYLPFFSGAVQYGAQGACKGTRAHTRAHTSGSPDHALFALRPSALPPVKTRRSTLPSLRARGRGQALQLTSNLANEKLTSYRRECNNGHTELRFCPFRPILQTVIQPGAAAGAGRGVSEAQRASVYDTRGKNDGAASPALLFPLRGTEADKPLPRGMRARAAAPGSHGIAWRPPPTARRPPSEKERCPSCQPPAPIAAHK